jgi:hypothetical protein
MKRITLLFSLLAVSFGYAQTDVIESFDGDEPTIAFETGGCAPGTATLTDEQSFTGANSLKIITTAAGNAWQGTELVLQDGESLDLTTNKTITVDVWSEFPAGILAKVTVGGDPGTSAALHTGGSTWQTLTFNLDDASDGASVANGIYTNLLFYPLWGPNLGVNYDGQDGAGNCVTPNPNTIYIDNIIGTSGLGAPSCTNGILDNEEEEIDCGGPNCVPCSDPSPTPPNYTVHLALQDNITDTGTFTNFWNADDFFGATPTFADLDNTAAVNIAAQINLGIGWGGGQTAGGNLATTDVSAYDTVHIDYFIPSSVDPGVNGHQFYLDLISRTNNANSEAFYGVGLGLGTGGDGGSGVIDEQVVFDTWVGLDIPMATMVAKGFDSSNFFQFKIGAQSDIRTQLGYFDNIYFYDSATLSTNQFETVVFSVYPNPTKNNWNIKSNTTISSIMVYDILGKLVSTLAPNATNAEISTDNITAGIYFARIDGINGSSKTVKLIKE